MLSYGDKTFCASPQCNNACGRKITKKDKEIARKMLFPIAWGMFCGEVSTEEFHETIKKEFSYASLEQQTS